MPTLVSLFVGDLTVFMQTLRITGLGMLGIFLFMALFYVMILLLNAVFPHTSDTDDTASN